MGEWMDAHDGVLVYLGCHDKASEIEWLKNKRNVLLTVQKAENSKIKVLTDGVCVEGPLLG